MIIFYFENSDNTYISHLDKRKFIAYDKNKDGGDYMSKAKREQEREWTVRKQKQKPHGKVKTKKELAEE